MRKVSGPNHPLGFLQNFFQKYHQESASYLYQLPQWFPEVDWNAIQESPKLLLGVLFQVPLELLSKHHQCQHSQLGPPHGAGPFYTWKNLLTVHFGVCKKPLRLSETTHLSDPTSQVV